MNKNMIALLKKSIFLKMFFLLFIQTISTNQNIIQKKNCIALSQESLLLRTIKKDSDIDVIKNNILAMYNNIINELENINVEDINQENADLFFEKTYQALDLLQFETESEYCLLYNYLLLGKNQSIKEKIQNVLDELNKYFINHFTFNQKHYNILKKISIFLLFKDIPEHKKQLITQVIEAYESRGIHLNLKEQENLKTIFLELEKYNTEFELNIQNDTQYIIVTKEELTGLTDNQLNKLIRLPDGTFKIKTDYPTYNIIMSYCSNQKIRKQAYEMFLNKAYPQNENILEQIRKLKHEEAVILDFSNATDQALKDQMVKTTSAAQAFLTKIKNITTSIAIAEKNRIYEYATKKGYIADEEKINPWDITYMLTQYEEEIFDINQEKIKEYFPITHIIETICNIVNSFFGIQIKKIEYQDNTWKYDDSIITLRLYKNEKILGDLLLDLFPREGKYNHFCFSTVRSSIYENSSTDNLKKLPLGIIIGNFAQPEKTGVALLTYDELITFFHEFGHTLHHFLGTTEFFSQSGIKVIHDFVEVPSQLFERWPQEKSILKMLSHHWQTGESLPEEIIEKLIHLQNFYIGLNTQRQIMLSAFSLELFENPTTSIEAIYNKNSKDSITISFLDPQAFHRISSFGHIISNLYGPKYYGYLWAKVFSMAIFEKIKQKNGLLNNKYGQELIDKILSKGGSIDPNILMKEYLNEFNPFDAFYEFLYSK